MSTHGIHYGVYMYIDGLVQERRNSSALAMELHLSCTNPLICHHVFYEEGRLSTYVLLVFINELKWKHI